MSKSIVAAIAIATSILIAPNGAQAGGLIGSQQSLTTLNQVQQVKQSRRHKKRNFRHNRHNRHRNHRHAGGNYFFGGHYFDGHSYRTCRRLKRKAYHTGSRYWWNKYHRCMDRNYF